MRGWSWCRCAPTAGGLARARPRRADRALLRRDGLLRARRLPHLLAGARWPGDQRLPADARAARDPGGWQGVHRLVLRARPHGIAPGECAGWGAPPPGVHRGDSYHQRAAGASVSGVRGADTDDTGDLPVVRAGGAALALRPAGDLHRGEHGLCLIVSDPWPEGDPVGGGPGPSAGLYEPQHGFGKVCARAGGASAGATPRRRTRPATR